MERLDEAEAQAELMGVLASAFPAADVPSPEALRMSRWGADRLFGGAYSFLRAGALGGGGGGEAPSGWEALQLPLTRGGSVWLAGEACDPDFSGFLHGALRSGRLGAERLLRATG